MDPQTRAIIDTREDVQRRLKRMLIEELHLDLEPDEIDPDAALFGSGLDLDSIDAVEIATLIETRLDVKLRDVARKNSFRTLNTLTDTILEARGHGSNDPA